MNLQVNKKLRNNEYYNFQDTLDNLYKLSTNKNHKFKKLYDLIISEQNILLAINNLKSNSGSMTPGTDKLTIKDYTTMNYQKLVKLIQDKLKDYNPRKIRRVNIPKDNGKTRNLGIPCLIDRIIQMMFLNILEPICEAKFYHYSYGFRPNRSAEHALMSFNRRVNLSKTYYIVSIDIKSFFDNIDHGKLLKQLWTLGIQDKKVFSIISKMLKSKVLGFENLSGHQGTPQGGILSPLLANVVLNELDWWISSQWENFPVTSAKVKILKNGTKGKSDTYSSLRESKRSQNMKECYIVRYADDFNILCRKRSDAQKLFYATKDFLKHRLHLEINEEKSKIVNLKKKSIDFLGFKIRTKKQQAKRTNIVVQTNICDKKVKVIKSRLRKEYKGLQKPKNKFDIECRVNKLNLYIIGLHNYFKVATNVNLDFSKINYATRTTLYNRLHNRITEDGCIEDDYIKKKYGKSKQLRWLDNEFVLIPIAYVQHEYPMSFKNGTNKYTEEGRKIIHKTLDKNVLKQIHLMMSHPIRNRSIEYNSNRISKYSMQKGKCLVTGQVLMNYETHCHHIQPMKLGGTDKFENLVILHKDIHHLVHLVDIKKINDLLVKLRLNKKQIDKVNYLREQCNLKSI